MPTYSFTRKQVIPCDIDAAWSFFSSPQNLHAITPGYMNFRIITSNAFDQVYAGQLIKYILRPLPAFSFYWMTEITHVVPRQYFVDEQRYGPYAFWHHQHHFAAVEGGILMTDIVTYRMGIGILGRLAHRLYVRDRLKDIFDYRYKKIIEIFGAAK